jgi:hypothetical protein
MSNYIYIVENSISTELCKDIIKQFDTDKELCLPGVTSKGCIREVKDSLDLNIMWLEHEWTKVTQVLCRELTKHCHIYCHKHNKPSHKYEIDTMQIQRYAKNVGHFKLHVDEQNTYVRSRDIVFMWYLNDVENGGETCFPEQDIDVKPEAGKLVLFPSTWTYPHRANIPLSSNKYIITGWFYKYHTE